MNAIVNLKPLALVLSAWAVMPVSAADAPPFAPAPFRLESPRSASSSDFDAAIRATGVRLDFPIGPVRIDYGVPIDAGVPSGTRGGWQFLDAPGAGYREQRDRTGSK